MEARIVTEHVPTLRHLRETLNNVTQERDHFRRLIDELEGDSGQAVLMKAEIVRLKAACLKALAELERDDKGDARRILREAITSKGGIEL